MASRAPNGSFPDDAPPGALGPMSFEAYLAFLARTEWRYEYMNGMAYAMAGAALALDGIYEDVELPPEPPRATRVFEEAVGA